jgi:hypothetical protein
VQEQIQDNFDRGLVVPHPLLQEIKNKKNKKIK